MATRLEDIRPPMIDIADEGAPRPRQEGLAGGPYKLSPSVAAYRQDDPEGQYVCASCAAFKEPKHCMALKSTVEPTGHCDLWEPAPGGTDQDTPQPVNRKQVNYEQHRQGVNCEQCIRFEAPDQCSIVQGEVAPVGFCRLFDRSVERPQGRTGGLGQAATDLLMGQIPGGI
jgi:hypothetical protein